jgi:ParB family chromosome partitioning protein
MEIRTIATSEVHPDPNNPRGKKLRDIDSLKASIQRLGQLEPIVVREVNGKGGAKLQIISGHRRHAACTALKIPITYRIATPEEEREAALQGLVMNIQRDDLSPVERSRGIQHVLDLGVTTEEAAAGLAIPVAQVEQASVIAHAKQTIKEAEKPGAALSFDMVLGLAEFEDSPDWYDQLLATAIGSPEEWPYEIEGARQERERERAQETLTREWKDKGYRVYWSTSPSGNAVRLEYLTDDKGASITPAKHAKCESRAVWIVYGYDYRKGAQVPNVVHYCLDPEANGHTRPESKQAIDTSGARLKPRAAAESEQATRDRRTNLAMINAEKAARVVRRDFVKKLLERKTPPPGVLRFAVEYMVGYRVNYSPRNRDAFIEIVPGAEKGETYGRGQRSMAEAYVQKGTDQHLALGLFAFCAAEIEGAWEPNSWRGERGERMRYLDLLAKCGYTLSLVEKVQVGKAKADAVLADADKKRAQRTAKKA